MRNAPRCSIVTRNFLSVFNEFVDRFPALNNITSHPFPGGTYRTSFGGRLFSRHLNLLPEVRIAAESSMYRWHISTAVLKRQ